MAKTYYTFKDLEFQLHPVATEMYAAESAGVSPVLPDHFSLKTAV